MATGQEVVEARCADDIYGKPEDTFPVVEDIMEELRTLQPAGTFPPGLDHAQQEIVHKLVRMRHSPYTTDHYRDIQGYAYCGYRCALSDNPDMEAL